jgi:hypothetical protein
MNACGQVFDCGDPCPRLPVRDNDCLIGACSLEGYCVAHPQVNGAACWNVGERGNCCNGDCLRGNCL